MARPVFFAATNQTLDELTQLFSFVWPTAAAMWNLRWQVRDYLDQSPKATDQQLFERFVSGSGIHGAGNLKGACVEASWTDQQQVFAKFLLIDICAQFESWVTQVLGCLGVANSRLEKKLQFPTVARGSQNLDGVRAAIDDLTAPESRMLRLSFYDELRASPKNSLANLDNLLRCYRYFKECRNCLAHNGSIADSRAVTAYNEFAPAAFPSMLDVSEVPLHQAVAIGETVRLELRGVVGFSNVVIRIISTLDAELSRSAKAEAHLRQRWTLGHSKHHVLKADKIARDRQVKRLIAKLGLPRPIQTTLLDPWLCAQRLVN